MKLSLKSKLQEVSSGFISLLVTTPLLCAMQGSLSAIEAGAGRAGVFHNVGPAAKATPDAADAELRRLQQEVCPQSLPDLTWCCSS